MQGKHAGTNEQNKDNIEVEPHIIDSTQKTTLLEQEHLAQLKNGLDTQPIEEPQMNQEELLQKLAEFSKITELMQGNQEVSPPSTNARKLSMEKLSLSSVLFVDLFKNLTRSQKVLRIIFNSSLALMLTTSISLSIIGAITPNALATTICSVTLCVSVIGLMLSAAFAKEGKIKKIIGIVFSLIFAVATFIFAANSDKLLSVHVGSVNLQTILFTAIAGIALIIVGVALYKHLSNTVSRTIANNLGVKTEIAQKTISDDKNGFTIPGGENSIASRILEEYQKISQKNVNAEEDSQHPKNIKNQQNSEIPMKEITDLQSVLKNIDSSLKKDPIDEKDLVNQIKYLNLSINALMHNISEILKKEKLTDNEISKCKSLVKDNLENIIQTFGMIYDKLYLLASRYSDAFYFLPKEKFDGVTTSMFLNELPKKDSDLISKVFGVFYKNFNPNNASYLQELDSLNLTFNSIPGFIQQSINLIADHALSTPEIFKVTEFLKSSNASINSIKDDISSKNEILKHFLKEAYFTGGFLISKLDNGSSYELPKWDFTILESEQRVIDTKKLNSHARKISDSSDNQDQLSQVLIEIMRESGIERKKHICDFAILHRFIESVNTVKKAGLKKDDLEENISLVTFMLDLIGITFLEKGFSIKNLIKELDKFHECSKTPKNPFYLSYNRVTEMVKALTYAISTFKEHALYFTKINFATLVTAKDKNLTCTQIFNLAINALTKIQEIQKEISKESNIEILKRIANESNNAELKKACDEFSEKIKESEEIFNDLFTKQITQNYPFIRDGDSVFFGAKSNSKVLENAIKDGLSKSYDKNLNVLITDEIDFVEHYIPSEGSDFTICTSRIKSEGSGFTICTPRIKKDMVLDILELNKASEESLLLATEYIDIFNVVAIEKVMSFELRSSSYKLENTFNYTMLLPDGLELFNPEGEFMCALKNMVDKICHEQQSMPFNIKDDMLHTYVTYSKVLPILYDIVVIFDPDAVGNYYDPNVAHIRDFISEMLSDSNLEKLNSLFTQCNNFATSKKDKEFIQRGIQTLKDLESVKNRLYNLAEETSSHLSITELDHFEGFAQHTNASSTDDNDLTEESSINEKSAKDQIEIDENAINTSEEETSSHLSTSELDHSEGFAQHTNASATNGNDLTEESSTNEKSAEDQIEIGENAISTSESEHLGNATQPERISQPNLAINVTSVVEVYRENQKGRDQ